MTRGLDRSPGWRGWRGWRTAARALIGVAIALGAPGCLMTRYLAQAAHGQLELLGKALPVTLEARWNKSGQYELPGTNAYVMGVSAKASFKRSAFGMSYGVANGWVGDTVEMMFEFEARRR
jgi:hypothetical protein